MPEKPYVYPLRPHSKNNRNFIGCPICFNEYNAISNFPMILPSCGHTVCKVCLEKIAEERTVIKCPVCRAMNFKDVYSLPVNYALLDISENKEHREMCLKHKLEIVAYCKDEDTLLCGACIFEHKNHESFLLTDPRADEIANKKIQNLKEKEADIKKVKKL